MNERKIKWNYNHVGTSEDKSGTRTSTPSKSSYEVVGVDMSVRGGIRPFPGFKKVHTFTSLRTETNHSSASEVIDVFPISFRVGTDQFGYGFVYRAKRPGDTSVSDIYMDYRIEGKDSGAWTTGEDIKLGVATSAPMDVVVFGRYVYVLVKGEEPILFYVGYGVSAAAAGSVTIEAFGSITKGTPSTADLVVVDYTAIDTATPDNFKLNPTDGSGVMTFEASATTTDATHFKVELSNAQTVTNIRTMLQLAGNEKFNAGLPSGSTITISQNVGGTAGDKANSTTCAAGILTIANFTGGAGTADSIVLKNTVGQSRIIHAGTENENFSTNSVTDYAAFKPETDNPTTATNLATVVNAHTNFTASEGQNSVNISQATTSINGNQVIGLNLTVSTCITKVDFEGGAGAGYGTDYLRVIETDTGPGLQPPLISPNDTDVTTVGALDVSSASYPSNAQVFTAQTVGSHWYATPEDMDNVADLDSGGYGVAYYLEDPDTGRKTSLSKVAMVKPENLVEKATGSITCLDNAEQNYDGKTITIKDHVDYPDKGKQVVFTIDSDTSGTAVKVSDTSYTIKIDGAADKEAVAALVHAGIDLAHTNNDLNITPTYTASTDVINLTHDKGTLDGNATISTSGGAVFTVVGMTGAENFDPGYIGLEIVYDSTKFTKARIFRSVKLEDAGGSYVASVVQLDKIITLQDYWTTNQDDPSTGLPFEDTADAFEDYRRAIYYFRLSDLALIYQDPYVDRSIFDENMSKAGTGIEFDGILITSNSSGDSGSSQSDGDSSTDRFRGVGEFRWSSMAESSPELFPPENYFVPSKVSNHVVTFERSAGAVLGFAENIIMHISREFTGNISYMKILPVHEGYGIVNKRATESVGPFTYYINNKGMKSIDAQGRLDSLHAIDKLVEEWGSEYGSLSMGYDSESSVLFILNSAQKKAACMWFSTSSVSELHDLPFDLVKTGEWPSDLNDQNSDLTQRAFFLQNAPNLSDTPAHWSPCVWIADSKREDTITGSAVGSWNGKTRTTLLHFDKDTRFRISAVAGSTFTIDPSTSGHESVAPVFDTGALSWIGAYVYCISSTKESNIGKKCQIVNHSGTPVVVTYQNLDSGWTPAVGDRIAISPVYVKWGGSLLGYNDPMDPQNPTPSGMHIVRKASAFSCYFSDVSGAPTTDTVNEEDLFYKASVYEGDSTTALSTGIPKNLSGNIVTSILEGESTNWASMDTHGVRGIALAPALEVFCPDLDFRLLSVIIEGMILPTLRTERAT